MTLLETLRNDITVAMKEGDAERREALRFVMAALHNREIEKRGKSDTRPLSDEETVDVLQRELKKKRESIALFRRGGRADLASKEEREIRIIECYVPASLGKGEILRLIAAARAKGITEFGLLMKDVMGEAKGRADGRLVAELLKKGE